MNIDVEKDEEILALNGKLFKYREKINQLEGMKSGGIATPNVLSLLEKLKKATKITENLIEKRRIEIVDSLKVVVSTKVFRVGEHVFAKKPKFSAWYVAVVERIMEQEDISKSEYAVKFLGETPPIHNIVSFHNKSIREYSLPRKYLRTGVSILAIYEKDQLYYRAVIDKLDDVGWLWVRFKGYSGVQKTREEHIRLEATFGKELYGEETRKKKKDQKDNITGKKRKRKDSNMGDQDLRRKTNVEKKQKLDHVLSKRKKSWKSFLEKGSKKKLKGLKKSGKSKKGDNSKFGIVTENQIVETTTVKTEDNVMFNQERNRKRKGAVMQRPIRKNRVAENVLQEMEIVQRINEDRERERREKSRNRYNNGYRGRQYGGRYDQRNSRYEDERGRRSHDDRGDYERERGRHQRDERDYRDDNHRRRRYYDQ